MKKLLCAALAAVVMVMSVFASGCGSDKEQQQTPPPPAKTGAYDIDLTDMSSTMVYSEVYNMMTEPDKYMGKSVKMTGTFAVYEGDERNYYACIISDATACCSQGIEFVLDGEYVYPQDYPELGSEITVTGTFDTYYEDDIMYCQLCGAKML